VALTARSLHCRDFVRLHSYFHHPDEPAGMPAHDPEETSAVSTRCDAASLGAACDVSRIVTEARPFGV